MTKLSDTFLEKQTDKMDRYYAFHSRIYDATRWTFLFGRDELIKSLPFQSNESFRLLEVGCGTGYNLMRLHKQYVNAHLTGLDIAKPMLVKAEKKFRDTSAEVQFVHAPYHSDLHWAGPFNAIVFSYSLSMINPHWNELIDTAYEDLCPGGVIGVSDFHDSKMGWFKRWMGVNHVRMDGHLLAYLKKKFHTVEENVVPAYGNVWQYMMYIGRKE